MQYFSPDEVDGILYQSEGREGPRPGQRGHSRSAHVFITNEEMMNRLRFEPANQQLGYLRPGSKNKNMAVFTAFTSAADQARIVAEALTKVRFSGFYGEPEGTERTIDTEVTTFRMRLATGAGVMTVNAQRVRVVIAQCRQRIRDIHIITAYPGFLELMK